MIEQKVFSFEGLVRLRTRQESMARQLFEQAAKEVADLEAAGRETPDAWRGEALVEARATMEFHHQKLLEAMSQRQMTARLQDRFATMAVGQERT